jgi:hypothetical protein
VEGDKWKQGCLRACGGGAEAEAVFTSHLDQLRSTGSVSD